MEQDTPNPRPLKVAIAIEMHYNLPWHLDMCQGIMRYGEEHGWSCIIDPYLLSLQAGKASEFDGVIGRLNKEIYRALEGLDLPAVNVMGSNFVEYLEHVQSLRMDMAGMMRIAVEHLIACGYRRFGYLGQSRLPSNEKKLDFLAEMLSAHGFEPLSSIMLPDDFEIKRESTLEVVAQLTRWLERLETPVGLLVQEPTVPSLLMPLCKQMGLQVPKDVGVVGLSSNDATSSACSPTLSYVRSDWLEHGYQAAALLEKLMAGEKMHPKHQLFAPAQVVVRESSDVFLCDDPLVSDAVRFIAAHVRQNPSIAEVADHLCVSRRTLERRFPETLGRTIQAEIKRLRIEHIRRLLQETERSMSDIARDFGFSSASYFTKYWKTELGMTPSEYRKRYGDQSAG